MIKNHINHLFPLTPTSDAEDCKIYLDTLDWALKNRSKIRNIAIAGPYGSGKSSIIRTYIKNYKKNIFHLLFPNKRFLNISLATFKDITNEEEKSDTNNDIQRLIELSILQQLFFHEKESKIPDSRFRKIKRHTKIQLLFYTFVIMGFLASVLYQISPSFIEKFFIFELSENLVTITHKIASGIAIITSFFLVLKFSRTLTHISIKKLNLKNAKIEIDKGISKSVLNNHIDEIIYFFEATKYNVVIIEDLDRFKQSEVFTKLREINLLINSSKKITQSIVFIYAIKDDMFLDKERAKFFDFIIPVIPVINFSNSGVRLRKITTENNYQISENLLDDLSMFIDDLRLLYNILNEFYIYYNNIGKNLIPDNLLAIIVYKNIFPNDFSLLIQNDGDLYKTITKKSQFLNNRYQELDEQITNLQNQINLINSQKNINIKELRLVYIVQIIENIKHHGFIAFSLLDKKIGILQLCETDNFNTLFSGRIEYFYSNINSTRKSFYDFKFKDIEMKVNPNLSYKEREQAIDQKDDIEFLKEKINELRILKSNLPKKKLKDLIFLNEIQIKAEEQKKNELIYILLRNGYIDENYINYISIFHEGSLTRVDYDFLLNVKTEKKNPFNLQLCKTTELIKKIGDLPFEKEFILNFTLIDTLLKEVGNETKKAYLFSLLSTESDYVISFIDEFINETSEIEIFVTGLSKSWVNIWNYIFYKSDFNNEKKEKYLILILHYCNLDNIKNIFKQCVETINSNTRFLKLPLKLEKMKQIFKILNLMLNSFELDSPKELLSFVIENNYFKINIINIKTILDYKGYLDEGLFQRENYGFIKSTNQLTIIDFIESNINQYIENVYLKLDLNKEEKLENYIDLLNHENIEYSLKENIIKKVDTKIDNIKKITDKSILLLLFKFSKVIPTWNNILYIYKISESIFSDEVITFLNIQNNAEQISKIKIPTKKNNEGLSVYSELAISLIYQNNISIELFKYYVQSIPWSYTSFDVNSITEEKIDILIQNNIFSPVVESYDFLKDNYKNKNILFLENQIKIFESELENISIDSEDLEIILKSKKIGVSTKIRIINFQPDDIILLNSNNSKMVIEILFKQGKDYFDETLIRNLALNKSVSIPLRLKIFNHYIEIIENNYIIEFLTSLDGLYKIILDKNKKAVLEKNKMNEDLLNNLKRLNFISSFSRIKDRFRVNHKR